MKATKKSLMQTGWALALLLMAMPATAIEVEVSHQDLTTCDPLFVPDVVDELGIAFPPDELIRAVDTETTLIACPSNDLPELVNALVEITNFTQRSFSQLWYVADPETLISNVDGLVNDMPAFRIDSRISNPGGTNLPLIFESGAINDVFEPGEVWRFIIDDYRNGVGLPPSALTSAGLVGALSGGDQLSSGSIIAVPEPAAIGMLLLGLAGIVASALRRTP
jgi:hypothetical protein